MSTLSSSGMIKVFICIAITYPFACLLKPLCLWAKGKKCSMWTPFLFFSSPWFMCFVCNSVLREGAAGRLLSTALTAAKIISWRVPAVCPPVVPTHTQTTLHSLGLAMRAPHCVLMDAQVMILKCTLFFSISSN